MQINKNNFGRFDITGLPDITTLNAKTDIAGYSNKWIGYIMERIFKKAVCIKNDDGTRVFLNCNSLANRLKACSAIPFDQKDLHNRKRVKKLIDDLIIQKSAPKHDLPIQETPQEPLPAASTIVISLPSIEEPSPEQLLYIEAFVNKFLAPYLNGEITAETEDRDRLPLIESLYPKFLEQFPDAIMKKERLEELALNAYVFEAASGINRAASKNLGAPIPIDPRKADQMGEGLSMFHFKFLRLYVISLGLALMIDFKDRALTDEQIIAMAESALIKIADEWLELKTKEY